MYCLSEKYLFQTDTLISAATQIKPDIVPCMKIWKAFSKINLPSMMISLTGYISSIVVENEDAIDDSLPAIDSPRLLV